MFNKSCGQNCPRSTKCAKWLELVTEVNGKPDKTGKCSDVWAVMIAIEARIELTKILQVFETRK